jgi:hypothetical protein
MERYEGKDGIIIKFIDSSEPEYWNKGSMVAKGTMLSDPNSGSPPTPEDWEFCRDLLKLINDFE